MGWVTIRIWDGPTVRHIVSVSPSGSTTLAAVGGAANSARPDIELDPWRGLIVDHRAARPAPVSIRSEE